jgi:hypothetical protein
MDLLAGLLLLLQAASPRDIVTLEMYGNAKDGCAETKVDFRRSYPDGTVSADSFRVPEGKALVVTDVDWYYTSGLAGAAQVLSVVVENIADRAKRRRAFESTVRLGPDGVGGISEHMTTGFVVRSSARLCAETRNGPIGSPLRLSVLLRGYLTEER